MKAGETHLRQSIHRLRRPNPPAPLSLDPSNAFEVQLAQQIQYLQAEIDRLNNRLTWLYGLIIASAVSNVVLGLLQ